MFSPSGANPAKFSFVFLKHLIKPARQPAEPLGHTMASKRAFSEEDFTCPVCCDIFKEPVLLSCGHSGCRRCVRRYWRSKGSRECPLCRGQCSRNPPVNLALRNLSQTFQQVQEDQETLCDIHGEKLKLYCVDEARPVCVVCRDSHTHQHHTFRPVEEVAAGLKKTLQSELQIVTAKSKNFQDAQFNYHQNIDHIKKQAKHIENRIKEEFKKLHQFLGNEMIPMLNALREEAKEKTQRLEEKVEKINQEEETLSKTATDIEKELQSEDIKLIKNFEKTLGKAQCMQMDPEVAPKEVISVAKYLGNLQFRVWEKMKNSIKYTPVLLDEHTAHNQLALSADLTSVNVGDDQEDQEDGSNVKSREGPDIPERFDRCLCVLGSEGFSVGVHSWDVEVGNNTFWMVGVATESVHRKEPNVFPSGAWAVGFDNERLCARSPSEPYVPLSEAAKPQVVRVHLDMNAGEVQFSDPLSSTVIHTFKQSFTEKVFPFFHTLCCLSPLKILPLQPFVELRRCS